MGTQPGGQASMWRIAALIVAATGLSAWGAAPPRSPALTPAQVNQVQRWQEQRVKHLFAGEFTEADKLARQVLALRQRVQGPRHWETLDARFEADRCRRLAALPASKRAAVGKGLHRREE